MSPNDVFFYPIGKGENLIDILPSSQSEDFIFDRCRQRPGSGYQRPSIRNTYIILSSATEFQVSRRIGYHPVLSIRN